jgi:2-hydroxy-6-oxonona-2,4-dienedioate hydrolase
MPSISIEEKYADADGVNMRYLEAGTGPAVVLLHGGTPGATAYSGIAEIWEPWIEDLAKTHRVIALDMPGSGSTRIRDVTDLTVEGSTKLVASALESLSLPGAHIVAHAESSLVALRLAREGFAKNKILSCTLIAAHQASPTGDGLEDVTLLNPPKMGRQGWALDRLSYGSHHVTHQLLADLEKAWNGGAHQEALRYVAQPGADGQLKTEIARAKAELHGYCRDIGYDVPVSLVWGADDPTTTITHGHELMRFLSTTRAHLSFHIMNRVGHFPFREAPNELTRLVRPLLTSFSTT